eukprot:TRINITY_DN67030_c7_g5_i1.p1 TRINITY_DN67030_c7_g5~~TRINITY_DN67030_c7_g5_i1.p1  ORF type:complete len:470 (-),score=148.24 TRINITY_DN67030_c7_g5_i1:25-1434(-)
MSAESNAPQTSSVPRGRRRGLGDGAESSPSKRRRGHAADERQVVIVDARELHESPDRHAAAAELVADNHPPRDGGDDDRDEVIPDEHKVGDDVGVRQRMGGTPSSRSARTPSTAGSVVSRTDAVEYVCQVCMDDAQSREKYVSMEVPLCLVPALISKNRRLKPNVELAHRNKSSKVVEQRRGTLLAVGHWVCSKCRHHCNKMLSDVPSRVACMNARSVRLLLTDTAAKRVAASSEADNVMFTILSQLVEVGFAVMPSSSSKGARAHLERLRDLLRVHTHAALGVGQPSDNEKHERENKQYREICSSQFAAAGHLLASRAQYEDMQEQDEARLVEQRLDQRRHGKAVDLKVEALAEYVLPLQVHVVLGATSGAAPPPGVRVPRERLVLMAFHPPPFRVSGRVKELAKDHVKRMALENRRIAKLHASAFLRDHYNGAAPTVKPTALFGDSDDDAADEEPEPLVGQAAGIVI